MAEKERDELLARVGIEIAKLLEEHKSYNELQVAASLKLSITMARNAMPFAERFREKVRQQAAS